MAPVESTSATYSVPLFATNDGETWSHEAIHVRVRRRGVLPRITSVTPPVAVAGQLVTVRGEQFDAALRRGDALCRIGALQTGVVDFLVDGVVCEMPTRSQVWRSLHRADEVCLPCCFLCVRAIADTILCRV